MKPNKETDLRKARAVLDRKRAKNSTDENPLYVEYHHPENLFTMDYPAHWKLERDSDGAVLFSQPDSDGFIGMMIFRSPLQIDTKIIRESRKWEQIAQAMFKQVDSTNIRHDPTVIYSNYKADRPEPNEGGHRWFILAADLILCVSTTVPKSVKETWHPVFERMLSSLRVDRDDEVLATRVINRVHAKLTSELPEAKIEVKGLTLVVDRLEIAVDNLLPQVKRNPADLHAIVDRFIDGIVGMWKAQASIGQENWEEARTRIQPLIKSDKYVQDVNQITSHPNRENSTHASSLLISLPWLANLRICFAIDDTKTFRFVSNLDLNRWNITLEELARVSILNLVIHPFPEIIVESVGEGGPKVAALQPNGGAAASYMLHPELYKLASDQLGKNIVAAIPSRDVLILFEEPTTPQQHDALQGTVQAAFRETNHPISDRLFRVTPDGIALL